MPTFKQMRVRAIPRKDKATLYIGHSNDGEYFLQSNKPEVLAQLNQAATAQTFIDVDSTSFTKPQLGSMFVESISVLTTPSGLGSPLKTA